VLPAGSEPGANTPVSGFVATEASEKPALVARLSFM